MDNIKVYYGSNKEIKKDDRPKIIPSIAIVNEDEKMAFIFTKKANEINLKIINDGKINKLCKKKTIDVTHENAGRVYSRLFSFIPEEMFHWWNHTGRCEAKFKEYIKIDQERFKDYPTPVNTRNNSMVFIDEKNKQNKIEISFPFLPYSATAGDNWGIKTISFKIPNQKETNYTFFTERSPYAYCDYSSHSLPKFLIKVAQLPNAERLTKKQFNKKFNIDQNVNE